MIAFRGAGKRYRGWNWRETRALAEFTLDVAEGEVVGLAGPNGAGKSTLISLLLGFLAPSEGTVRIAGLEPRRFVERYGVGYLSELINIPPVWRVHHALQRYALLSGVPRRELTARVDAAIARLGLDEHRHKRIRQLSKGNLQRVGLAQALLCDERLVVLDEPTHGLDPVWTQRFRDIVDDLRRHDRVVLIASHNLDELARLADRVVILDHGRLQRIVDVRATVAATMEGAAYRFVLGGGDAAHSALRVLHPDAQALGAGEFEVDGASLESLNASLARLVEQGVPVRAFYPSRSALEEQFRQAVGGSTGRDA